MLEILEDAVLDSIKLIPFLLITYWLMEYLEHKMSDRHKEHMKQSGKMGPVIGSVLGAFPQCGFSVSATNLYCGRVISLGTLMAVYLSTSDEMIPVFLSEAVSPQVIFKVLLLKVVIGMIAGMVIDLIWRKETQTQNEISHLCEQAHCHCEEGILKSTLKHTIHITLFIFVMNLILNSIIHFVGEEVILGLLKNRTILGPILAGLMGLIPNCAASVMIAKLYIDEVISAGTMIGGLLVGAGVGLIVLVKENQNAKENLKIVSMLYLIGVLCGILLEAVGFVL